MFIYYGVRAEAVRQLAASYQGVQHFRNFRNPERIRTHPESVQVPPEAAHGLYAFFS